MDASCRIPDLVQYEKRLQQNKIIIYNLAAFLYWHNSEELDVYISSDELDQILPGFLPVSSDDNHKLQNGDYYIRYNIEKAAFEFICVRYNESGVGEAIDVTIQQISEPNELFMSVLINVYTNRVVEKAIKNLKSTSFKRVSRFLYHWGIRNISENELRILLKKARSFRFKVDQLAWAA